jgi:transposase InsO family protein
LRDQPRDHAVEAEGGEKEPESSKTNQDRLDHGQAAGGARDRLVNRVQLFNQARQHAYIQPCAIFHSDRGCQYTSTTVRSSLPPNWRQSMSAQGNCYDNAFAESCFASIKSEVLPDHGLFDSFEHAQRALFDYIKTFYNRRRLHSSIGFRSPLQFLELYFQSKTLKLN